MNEKNGHEDRNDDRKRDASDKGNDDREAVNRQRVDHVRATRALTSREREERWPIG